MTQIISWMCPKGAQVELERERCVPKVPKLSSEVSDCKPLDAGRRATEHVDEHAAQGGGLNSLLEFGTKEAGACSRPLFGST